MNQLTLKMVHHSNKKLAGRKSKPSNEMWLKTYHSGAVYCGIFHSRDSRLLPTIQPTEGMIGMSISLGYHPLLPVIDHFRVVFSAIFTTATLEEEDATRISLSVSKSLLLMIPQMSTWVRGPMAVMAHEAGHNLR
jgi:hypothetical protein